MLQSRNPTYLLNPVVGGLLGSDLLPKDYLAYEKVSAVIAVRYLVASTEAHRRLVFVVPGGTASTARCIVSGLLIASYGHENGSGKLPPEEVGRLLTGNVLLITRSPSRSINALRDVHFGGTNKLTEFWDVVPLAFAAPSTSQKRRLFVSDPGWMRDQILTRKFSAVVIDATHHKTQDQLTRLLDAARGICPVCIVVTPGTSEQPSDTRDIWLWDPIAQANAQYALEPRQRQPPTPAVHSMLICTEDSEADALLSDANKLATQAARLAEQRLYPGMSEIRTVLNRLRRLTVPLTRLEQASAKSWYGNLAQQLRKLSDVSGHGNAAWDATWPTLRAATERAYKAFLDRKETAKFWPIATHLDGLLRGDEARIRVVVSTREEVELLATDLNIVLDGISNAVAIGRLEIVTSAEEARQVSDGDYARTILPGPRRRDLQFLNLFPPHPVNEFLYPFEVDLEMFAVKRQYAAAEALCPQRAAILQQIRLDLFHGEFKAKSPSPSLHVMNADGRPISLSNRSRSEGEFDLEDLLSPSDSMPQTATSLRDAPAALRSGHTVSVSFLNGAVMPFVEGHVVDVYYSETDQLEREKVEDLKPGMRVLQFVDGHYDDLFFRTTLALRQKLEFKDRARLEMWDLGKASLLTSNADKKALYESLCKAGLSSNYGRFNAWLGDDAQTMAPQQLNEFIVLAKATKLFPTEAMMTETFKCIQSMRGRHRALGRKLHSVLRALKTQSGYEDALDSIRKVDPDVADAYAAVRLAEVQLIERI
jgi:hypothetical protein